MASQKLSSAGFSGEILHPEDGGFAVARKRYSETAERAPGIIVLPLSANDISLALTIAQELQLRVAVKGGGNHPAPVSSVDNGIVIDLSRMQNVSLANDGESVVVEGGSTWGHVYTAVEGTGRACVGGGVHVVGVGGHLLGGGWGPLTARYGLACDNIDSATVVLADGQIVEANAISHSDLYWAIRGGSCQFGVVAKFVLRTVPHPGTFYTRNTILPEHALSSVLSTAQHPWNPEERLAPFMFFIRLPNPEKTPAINFILMGNQTFVKKYATFTEELIKDNQPIKDAEISYESIEKMSHSMDELLLHAPKRVITAGCMITGLWTGMGEELWAKWKQYSSDPRLARATVAIEFHGTSRRNPKSSCYPVQQKSHSSVILASQHDDSDCDPMAARYLNDMIDVVQKFQSDHGESLPLAFNGTSIPVQPERIWATSYVRLQKIKAQYDPKSIFGLFNSVKLGAVHA